MLFWLFFASGGCALAYQTAWQRMLGAFVGSDSVSTTIIVSAFLFGLGIGSLIGASFADRLSPRGALRAFALCEIGIGTFAFGSYTLFRALFLATPISHAGPFGNWLAVVLALLPATVLMGMSLPLLSRVVVDAIDGAAVRIGWLYGLNTLGAAAGAIVTGWILIGTLGFAMTVYGAAVVNLLIGAAALHFSRTLSSNRHDLPSPSAHAAGGREGRQRLALWSGMVFASGFLIVSLEIVWFRVLGTLMASDAYAFSLILGVFLLGDGLGVVAGAELAPRMANPRRTFQLLQGVMGIVAVGAFAAVFAINAHTTVAVFGVEGERAFAYVLAITLPIVLPPAFLLGMSFPITQRAVQDDPAMVSRRVGLVQLSSILGNTAGAVVTGLLLLHWLGTAPTVRLIGAGSLAFALAAFAESRHRQRDAVLVVALAGLIAIFPSNASFWSALHGTTVPDGATVIEDRTGIAVLRAAGSAAQRKDEYGDGGGPAVPHDTLFISGEAVSRVPFLMVHGALGVLGAMMHPNPEEIFIVGQGTGGTPIAAGVNAKTRHVRVVEIVSPVFEAMKEVARRSGDDVLHRPLRDYEADPRYTRVVADARHLLLTEENRYDIIEADAIYPTTALGGQLYSIEFFHLALRRLKPGGYMVQWQPTDRTLFSFLHVFPYVVRLNNFVLIGSADPIDISRDRLIAELAGPAGEYLAKMGWNRSQVASTLISGDLQRWGPGDPRMDVDVNTDAFPKDEYYRNHHKLDPNKLAFFRRADY